MKKDGKGLGVDKNWLRQGRVKSGRALSRIFEAQDVPDGIKRKRAR